MSLFKVLMLINITATMMNRCKEVIIDNRKLSRFPPLALWIQLRKCLSFWGRSRRGRFRTPAIAKGSFHSLKDCSGFISWQCLFLNIEATIIEFVRVLKLLQVCVWNIGRVLYKIGVYSLWRAMIFVLRNKKSNLLQLANGCLSFGKEQHPRYDFDPCRPHLLLSWARVIRIAT